MAATHTLLDSRNVSFEWLTRIARRSFRRAKAFIGWSTEDWIVDGYPVLVDVDGSELGPGWSAAPGSSVGFALNARARRLASSKIEDASGRTVCVLERALLRPQSYVGDQPWRTGAGYEVSHRWNIPPAIESGVYFLNGRSDLFVVVRASRPLDAPVAVLISTNTFNAYSTTASASLYKHPKQVSEVSFLRPFNQVKQREWRGMVEWIHRTRPFGVPVQFMTDFELEAPDPLAGVKVLIVVGHSEYWSRKAREAFDEHVAAGGHAIIAGGNVMKWQVRFGEKLKSLVSYKADAMKPPEQGGDPIPLLGLKTTRWYDPALRLPTVCSIGGDSVFGGFGVFRREKAAGWDGLRIIDASHPLLRGLGMVDGDLIKLDRVTEYDGAPIKGLDRSGRPVPDLDAIGAARLELLAYDWTYRHGHTIGTVHIMQRFNDSGVVLHLGAKECGDKPSRSPGKSIPGALVLQELIVNAVDRMLNGGALFAMKAERPVVYPMQTPWKRPLPINVEGGCTDLSASS